MKPKVIGVVGRNGPGKDEVLNHLQPYDVAWLQPTAEVEGKGWLSTRRSP